MLQCLPLSLRNISQDSNFGIQTLDSFLSTTLEYVDSIHDNVPYVMKAKELSTVTTGLRILMESFESPFLSEDLESVKA